MHKYLKIFHTLTRDNDPIEEDRIISVLPRPVACLAPCLLPNPLDACIMVMVLLSLDGAEGPEALSVGTRGDDIHDGPWENPPYNSETSSETPSTDDSPSEEWLVAEAAARTGPAPELRMMDKVLIWLRLFL